MYVELKINKKQATFNFFFFFEAKIVKTNFYTTQQISNTHIINSNKSLVPSQNNKDL